VIKGIFMDHLEVSSLNCFSTALLDRVVEKRRDPAWVESTRTRPGTGFVPVWGERNLILPREGYVPAVLSLQELEKSFHPLPTPFFLGIHEDRAYFGVDLAVEDSSVPEKLSAVGRFEDLRKIGHFMESLHGELLVYSKAMAYWHRSTGYCAACGSPNASADGGHLLICTNEKCAREHFPRTDPAIIVLVSRGDKCLLGRQPVWPRGWYSTLAGFVEPGESVEHAVLREVYEESGVRVKNVIYHSSQPWPFPRSVMLGFRAEAETREIRVDGREIERAAWFSRRDILEGLEEKTLRLPPRVSISRRLIEDWFDAGDSGRLHDLAGNI